ncbi:MAG: choice-of-anchor L domain-containing protein [Ferruginibacter sp.]
MNRNLPRLIIVLFFILTGFSTSAQLNITSATSAQEIAQKLVGDGVSISNVSFTGNLLMSGTFVNNGPNNINLDSGIVLTSGRANSSLTNNGVNAPFFTLADNQWFLPGDITLANEIGVSVSEMDDACVLEFDFTPLGDTIKFRYVFSSEEYTPDYVCEFNDAFGFFISGPGITGLKNIALIPGTNIPVSIFNVNNVQDPFDPLCPNNISYYIDNKSNTFSHDGHTVVLTAIARVQPCQTYHLKIVISDNGDAAFDSGVFLEAKSLSSNSVTLTNNTQTSNQGESYLVEGCVPGSFTITRPLASPSPLIVNLQYTGTAVNGTDVQTLPSSVVIPANQVSVKVDVFPIVDNLAEGIEFVKVFSLASCASTSSLPIDSTIFQIRDYDTLGVFPDTSIICRNSTLQLNTTPGYTTYQWTPPATLNNSAIGNPIAKPVTEFTTYIATATLGNCNARDSAFVRWKLPQLISTQNVNCKGGTSGQIIVSAGNEWQAPVEYAVNNSAYQSTGIFNNLPAGDHTVYFRDASGCIDSLIVPITQSFPDLVISDTLITPGTCIGSINGNITVTANGGNGTYQYSSDGIVFQNSNILNVPPGTYTITIKDGNLCTTSINGVIVDFINTVQLNTGAPPVICEGRNTILPATSNAQNVVWSPASSLNNSALLNPIASPVKTTTYIITATTGICSRIDSVTVLVNPAPVANGGPDASICFGGTTKLNGVGAMEYSWRPGNYLSSSTVAQPDVKPPATTSYYLKVKDFNGCESLKEDTVKVTVTQAVKIFAGNDTIVALGQPLQLNGKQLGDSTVTRFSWFPSLGINNANIADPIVLIDRDMTFILTGKTQMNCEGSDAIKIKVYKGPEIYVPTVFTPNNDGTNDLLKAIAVGMKEYRYFKIFNRWGIPVFSTKDFSKGWDGRTNGGILIPGTYVWMAETVDYKGNVIFRKGTTSILQ